MRGRRRFVEPTIHVSRETRYVTIRDERMERQLLESMRDFIVQAVGAPHSETASVLDYLRESCGAFIQGEGTAGSALIEWYVQISFSGCAGMSEVSAELALHWSDLWLRRSIDSVSAGVLVPSGFTPRGAPASDTFRTTFLPVSNFGYAACVMESDSFSRRVEFSFDRAFFDPVAEDDDPSVEQFASKYGELMLDRGCRCQLCMPGFAPVRYSQSD